MTSAVTSPPAAARACMLAGIRRHDSANGGHLRVDGGDGAPVVDNDGEGADEDGDETATTTVTSRMTATTGATAVHGWSGGDDGGARLHGARALRAAADEDEGGDG
ncbi:hypothetical protein [Oryza sativa Japonica Group]|uniref:Uncharacterized protein n=1 Tax=Oryza sativa subsp. japonica TaxID=39947 RepID=Q5ZB45_ORYSJ|nr:hypothetical protein [Oryza sativa Japonica Group]BAD53196.1 hypothetical protein [Oryza sativa Japonica Group]